MLTTLQQRRNKEISTAQRYVLTFVLNDFIGAEIAQSAQRLAKGWTAEGSEFESR
jgi:hypothetical protein